MTGPVLTGLDLAELHGNDTGNPVPIDYLIPTKRQTDTFWMAGISHGSMPLAPSGYQFYRNVHDFGAKG